MASHTEIKVGDRNWFVRSGGEDVEVEVLSKQKKASGRGWEFVLKNLSTGRKLTRGSGALRREGQPARTAPSGFGKKNGTGKKAPRTPRKPRAKAPAKPKKNKAAPDPFSFSTPLAPSSPPPSVPALGSLRGARKRKPRPSPAQASTKKSTEYGCELAEQICKAVRPCKTELEVKSKISDVMARHNLNKSLWYSSKRY